MVTRSFVRWARGQVEAAVIARVDHDWRPVPGTERRSQVDAIAIGYGFLAKHRACGVLRL